MNRILIIDDDKETCMLLDRYLSKKGYDTVVAYNGKMAVDYLKKNKVHLALIDFKLPDYNGVEILQKIKILDPKIAVIIITGYSDVRVAVDAVKKGAFEYVTKPLQPDEILLAITNALKEAGSKEKGSVKDNAESFFEDFVIGKSHHTHTVQKHINLIAPTDMSVVILGETGTGKEYVARAIHYKSKRAKKPFVAIDCGALPAELAGSELFGHVKGAFTGAVNNKEGSFEQANGGTLFLDEISNLSYENQTKMLRVLQERKIKRIGDVKDIPVDVRLIVASNEDLKTAVKMGDFREDIYHRINEFKIELASLRERTEDIIDYAVHFLRDANNQLDKNVKGFDEEVIKKFKSYTWPGNLRELNNVIKRAVLLCNNHKIDLLALPDDIKQPIVASNNDIEINFSGGIPKNLKTVTKEAEKIAILEVLKRTNYNKTETAKLLGVDRKTLYNKMKSHDIEQV